jgi:2-dehydropantoate 2-reductase
MKILVVGAGAVGGYFGTKLALAGHDVRFVARGAHGRALGERGIRVEVGSETLRVEVPIVSDVSGARGMEADVALVTVKAASLHDVANGLGAALAEGGAAVSLLNGLDAPEILAGVLGRERVVGGVAQVAARIVEPGVIGVDAPGRVLLAPLIPEKLPLAKRLAEEFSRAGFACDAKSDLARVLWTKLLWNAPFNAICALTDQSAGQVLERPELERLVRDAMTELSRVAAAEGVELDARMIDKTIDATRTQFAGSIPSMLQDVRAGRETEANALQGAVVERGLRHHVETPIHRTLLALVLGLARARRE